MANFTIRSMQRSDLDLAITWAAQEGWNPGLSDAASFYATDPTGYFIGEYLGEPVSCISAVAYDATFGFIGFYIVRPEFRGRGFGWQTWQHGIRYLGDRNIGLDGVVDQQENYRKSGFKLAYRNIRYQGTIESGSPKNELLPIAEVPFEQLVAFDAQFFPVMRRAFLQAWIQQPGSVGLARQQDGQLVGYGVIRPCQVGWKIGPLFAQTYAIAEELLQGLVAQTKGEVCFLDIPEVNPMALKLVETY
ncbi:MAG: GNAT family N-acetyltransferase, partial [Leptolyngbyaceae cyanobacterium bins.59]|nr:GNAT family N-acetyltransferase [Leptolyngbyaceae cyanobacterium bins.59]